WAGGGCLSVTGCLTSTGCLTGTVCLAGTGSLTTTFSTGTVCLGCFLPKSLCNSPGFLTRTGAGSGCLTATDWLTGTVCFTGKGCLTGTGGTRTGWPWGAWAAGTGPACRVGTWAFIRGWATTGTWIGPEGALDGTVPVGAIWVAGRDVVTGPVVGWVCRGA